MRGDIHFEPMTVGMILDAAIRIYFRNFWLLVGIAAVGYLPQLLLPLLVALAQALDSDLSMLIIMLGALGNLVWWLLLYPWTLGAATYAISRIYLGEEADLWKALRVALDEVGTLFLTSLIVSVIVFIGLLLLIVPGILWWLSYSLIVPVIMLEGTNSQEARWRSRELTRNYRGRILVLFVIVIFLQFVAQLAAIGLVGALFENILLTQAVQWVATVLAVPLPIVLTILLYYDLRIRKEGFDLELLSGALGRSRPQSTLGLV